jgi:hypothetical protein
VSASEKLKALEPPRRGWGDVISSMNYYFGPNARTLVSKESADSCVAASTVLRALPQIVAVVEAAERLQRDPRLIVADVDLRAALAALEEALS